MECGETAVVGTETGDVADKDGVEPVEGSSGDEESKDSEVEELIAEDFGAGRKPSMMPSPLHPK